MNVEETLQIIRKGVEEIIPEDELKQKLIVAEKEQRPLRIKYGIDPTGYDVHLGHLVPIRKMREFQDLGHTGVIIIGDYTAQIGDPTGRDATRKHLSADMVKENAKNYLEQLFMVLDREKTEIRRQSEWYGSMQLDTIMGLLSKFTLAQFMAHDTFRSRYENGMPLSLHELLYPLLQAYDSVAINADIELGATEQKFNILAGRELQRAMGKPAQVAVLSPILVGTDGIKKMGKSLKNYIAVLDTPQDKFGKVMSIPDSIIPHYFKMTTRLSPVEIADIEVQLNGNDVNPRDIKIRLAKEIVTLYHGSHAADEAEAHFLHVFSQKKIPDDMPEISIAEKEIWIVNLLAQAKLVKSNGEARRLIKQGAVGIDGEKIVDIDAQIPIKANMIIKVGKRRFCRILRKG